MAKEKVAKVAKEKKAEEPKKSATEGLTLVDCKIIGEVEKPSGKSYLKVIMGDGKERFLLKRKHVIDGDKVFSKKD